MPENQERKAVLLEQTVLNNVYHLEALTNVLERKGLLTSKEVLVELEVVVRTRGGRGFIDG